MKAEEGGYRRLQVYKKSYKAALAVYEMTKTFPQEEMYGLTAQMRRAGTSIPLNIAEGYGKRESQNEFKRFLTMAIGSTGEMSVLIDFARDLGYVEEEKHQKASAEYEVIGKMLSSLIKKVTEHSLKEEKPRR